MINRCARGYTTENAFQIEEKLFNSCKEVKLFKKKTENEKKIIS